MRTLKQDNHASREDLHWKGKTCAMWGASCVYDKFNTMSKQQPNIQG